MSFPSQNFEILNRNETVDTVLKTIASSTAQDRPFFVLNIDNVLNKFAKWTNMLPRVRPFYSVQCNDDEIVIQALASLGAGVSCGSECEIRQVLALGVEVSDIIFGQPHKIMSHLRFTARKDVRRMVFDNETELQKIQEIFPTASLILSINMADFEPKKGALKLLKLAHHLSMNVVGLKIQQTTSFYDAIKLCKKIFSDALFYGFNLKVLDLGGIPPNLDGSFFEDITLTINKALQKYFPVDSQVEILAEPGGYFVDSAYTLATTVHTKKTKIQNGEKYCMYYINDGVYGSFSQLLTGRVQAQPRIFGKAEKPCVKCTVWGPTCDSLDKVLEDVDLPELEVGDWLFFENLGAFTKVLATNFNDFPVAKTFSYISYDNYQRIIS